MPFANNLLAAALVVGAAPLSIAELLLGPFGMSLVTQLAPPLPQLPSGYFGMFTLAYFPRLWFRVMDARLLANAAQSAVDMAYKSVEKPVEGTILTVARESSSALTKSVVFPGIK